MSKIISYLQVTFALLAPPQFISVLRVGRPDGVNTSSMLCCLTTGSTVSAKNIKKFRDLLPGTNVFQLYGQTETAGPVTGFGSKQPNRSLLLYQQPSSVGIPIPGFSYKVSKILPFISWVLLDSFKYWKDNFKRSEIIMMLFLNSNIPIISYNELVLIRKTIKIWAGAKYVIVFQTLPNRGIELFFINLFK